MSTITYIVLPLLIFAAMNALTVFFSKRTFGVTIPVTLMLTTIIVYMSQLLFHTFDVGVIACIVIAAVGVAVIVTKRKDEKFRKNYFSDGFSTFVIIYILFLIVDYKRCISGFDEFSHWAKMVKEMYRLDAFYSVQQSGLLVHKEYPPFAAIFEVLWCRFIGRYSEGAATMALHVFEFSLLFPPFFEKIHYAKMKCLKKATLQFMLILSVGMCILIFDAGFFNALYIDMFVPIMYVYLIFSVLWYAEKLSNWEYFVLLLGQFCLILVKQMSISYVLLIWLFYTISEVDKFKTEHKSIWIVKNIGVLASPLTSYMLWNSYVKRLELEGQFELSSINLGTIGEILFGSGGTEIQRTSYVNYMKALFSRTISTGTFKMPYIALVIMAIVVLGIFYWKFKEVFSKKDFIKYLVLFVFGSIGYAFTMFVLYMFCYSPGEMKSLVSYERYMGSYIVSEYLLLCLLFFMILKRNGKQIDTLCFGALILAVSILVFDASRLGSFAPQQYWQEPGYNHRLAAMKIQENSSEEDDIFLISSNNCQTMYYINYYLDDRDMDTRYMYSNVAAYPINDYVYWYKVKRHIGENQYVYVWDTSENVNQMLGDMTDSGYLAANSLYKVEHDSTGYKLLFVQ